MIKSEGVGTIHHGESAELLLRIARCPIVDRCLNGDTTHPCSTIVRSQGTDSLDDFHAPEPWSGRLSIAPIWFLSSNPSIGKAHAQTLEKRPNVVCSKRWLVRSCPVSVATWRYAEGNHHD